MKTVFIAAVASLVLAGQAQALSCVRPDVARTFAWAAEADESYVILHGTFAFRSPAQRNQNTQRPSGVKLPSRFEGRYMGANGFVDAPPLDVTLEFECLSAWCGSIEAGEEIVAFVQQSEDGYTLSVDPCFSTTFAPTDDTLQRVTSCMGGTGCDAVPF